MVGSDAGWNLDSDSGNSFFGAGLVGGNVSDGNNNTFIGYSSGIKSNHGSGNTFIGAGTDYRIQGETLDNAIAIGHEAHVDCSNCAVIGGIGAYQVNVGIGTENPQEELEVNGNLLLHTPGNNPALIIAPSDLGFGKSPELIIQSAASAVGQNAPFHISRNAIYSKSAGTFRYIVNETNPGQASKIGFPSNGDLKFSTAGANTGAVDFIDHLIIKNDGKVGVGTTSPGYTFQVGETGDLTEARANAWNTFSERRWKTDLEVIENPIDKVSQIKGYFYKWKEGEDQTRQIGVIAQEVEEVLPEAVSVDSEGYKSVDYGKLSALLIETVKEQQNEIEILRMEMNELKEFLKSGK